MAIAYLMQKTAYVFPIIGGRKVEHLLANLEALEINLSDEHIKSLESEDDFQPGFPTWMIVRPSTYFISMSSDSYISLRRVTEAPLQAFWRLQDALIDRNWNLLSLRLEKSRRVSGMRCQLKTPSSRTSANGKRKLCAFENLRRDPCLVSRPRQVDS